MKLADLKTTFSFTSYSIRLSLAAMRLQSDAACIMAVRRSLRVLLAGLLAAIIVQCKALRCMFCFKSLFKQTSLHLTVRWHLLDNMTCDFGYTNMMLAYRVIHCVSISQPGSSVFLADEAFVLFFVSSLLVAKRIND
jgi:hypothetical protein